MKWAAVLADRYGIETARLSAQKFLPPALEDICLYVTPLTATSVVSEQVLSRQQQFSRQRRECCQGAFGLNTDASSSGTGVCRRLISPRRAGQQRSQFKGVRIVTC